jgi:hypothetical protein
MFYYKSYIYKRLLFFFFFFFFFIYGKAVLSPNPSGTRLWVTDIASKPSSLKTLGERRLGQQQMQLIKKKKGQRQMQIFTISTH